MNPYEPPPAQPARPGARLPLSRDLVRLYCLFGSLYFVQGVIEPTACLPFQPLESQLSARGYGAGEIGRFLGIIGIAWSLKPVFGLISDFFPLAGRRRQPYLLLSTLLTGAAFMALAAAWKSQGGGEIDGFPGRLRVGHGDVKRSQNRQLGGLAP